MEASKGLRWMHLPTQCFTYLLTHLYYQLLMLCKYVVFYVSRFFLISFSIVSILLFGHIYFIIWLSLFSFSQNLEALRVVYTYANGCHCHFFLLPQFDFVLETIAKLYVAIMCSSLLRLWHLLHDQMLVLAHLTLM